MARRSKWDELTVGCGSDAGYQRHRRNGQKPCPECRIAHAKWMARWRAEQKENV